MRVRDGESDGSRRVGRGGAGGLRSRDCIVLFLPLSCQAHRESGSDLVIYAGDLVESSSELGCGIFTSYYLISSHT